MNEKHFIWIMPMLLIIGFIMGYVLGLQIPKDITIGLDKDNLKIMNRSFNIQEKDSLDIEDVVFNKVSHINFCYIDYINESLEDEFIDRCKAEFDFWSDNTTSITIYK